MFVPLSVKVPVVPRAGVDGLICVSNGVPVGKNRLNAPRMMKIAISPLTTGNSDNNPTPAFARYVILR